MPVRSAGWPPGNALGHSNRPRPLHPGRVVRSRRCFSDRRAIVAGRVDQFLVVARAAGRLIARYYARLRSSRFPGERDDSSSSRSAHFWALNEREIPDIGVAPPICHRKPHMVDKTSASFRELFLSNRRALLRYLNRRVGRENAPDLLQETFVRLLSRETTAEIVDPPAYLRRTAGNLANDFARHRDREQKLVDPASAESIDAASDEPGADNLIEHAQRSARLAETVASLPPRCREIFEMRVSQNMSQRDIAIKLGISRKTVEQHFHLAMERCRAAIK